MDSSLEMELLWTGQLYLSQTRQCGAHFLAPNGWKAEGGLDMLSHGGCSGVAREKRV